MQSVSWTVSGHVCGLWILEKDSMEGAQPDLPKPIFIADAAPFHTQYSVFPPFHSAFKSRLHLSGVK